MCSVEFTTKKGFTTSGQDLIFNLLFRWIRQKRCFRGICTCMYVISTGNLVCCSNYYSPKCFGGIGAFRNSQSDGSLAHAHISGRQRIGQPH